MTQAQMIQQAHDAAADQLAAVLHANLANSVTGVYGLSGAGKSSLADTAAIHAWRVFKKQTLAYTVDLGGYGTKRLALIRAGIMFAYDPRNHVNPFETMELISQGAFPSYLLPGGGATQEERDRGWAPPDCELVLPQRKRWQFVCPNGHRVGQFYTASDIVRVGAITCACGHVCTSTDPHTRLEEQLVRSAGFGNIGHRIYDSMTAMNEWGMGDLQKQSALGLLPANSQGGSVLGGADALVSGTVKFGTSSKGQYGFVQNRSHDWIANTKAIAGHVIPPTMTFMVEMSKGDDESGGQPVFGPKIAGNARTSSVPGWLGNCVHAVREPKDPSTPDVMVHRLWLRNHVDPLDPRRVPYLAKTRGVPVGMPDYLEDPFNEPTKAWSVCSLDTLYTLLAAQVASEEAALKELFPDAPAFSGHAIAGGEETVVQQVAAAAGAGAGIAAVPRVAAGAGMTPAAAAPAAGRRPRVAQAAPSVAVAPIAPTAPIAAAPVPPPTALASAATAGQAAPVPAAASTASAPATLAGASAPVPAAASSAPAGNAGAAPVAVEQPTQQRGPVVTPPAPPQQPVATMTTASTSPPAPPAARPAPAGRRVPRPPVG